MAAGFDFPILGRATILHHDFPEARRRRRRLHARRDTGQRRLSARRRTGPGLRQVHAQLERLRRRTGLTPLPAPVDKRCKHRIFRGALCGLTLLFSARVRGRAGRTSLSANHPPQFLSSSSMRRVRRKPWRADARAGAPGARVHAALASEEPALLPAAAMPATMEAWPSSAPRAWTRPHHSCCRSPSPAGFSCRAAAIA